MGKRRRRSNPDAWWKIEVGGMPVWGILGALVVVAGMAVGTIAAMPQASTADPNRTTRPVPTFSFGDATPDPVSISLLSDSHAFNADSWWRRTMEANTVSGARIGAWESQPGGSAAALASRLDAAAAGGGYVVVQAGTNDIMSATSAEETLARVTALWDGITDRGATPVAALVPPSDSRPRQAAELNDMILGAASERGLPVIDVYTPVANADGSWIAGASGDGVHATAEASVAMADAARGQLEALAAS